MIQYKTLQYMVQFRFVPSQYCLEHHYMLEEATVPQLVGEGGCLVGLKVQNAEPILLVIHKNVIDH